MNSMTPKILITLTAALLLIYNLSCSSQKTAVDNPSMKTPTNTNIKYLALGDSYTIGQNVDELERWPKQLANKLEALNYTVESLQYIAETGWTTRNLIRSIEKTELNDYNLVSLSIGVNNQFQNQPFNIFKTEFELLLNKCIELAKDTNRVFVVSIPDYGVTPFGTKNSETIGKELDMYNAYISESCKKYHVRYVNITEISRQLSDSIGALANDNLHPSGSQYKEWTNKILPIVLEMLQN